MKDSSGICASVSGIYASPSLGNEIEQSICCTLRGTDGISRAGYPRLEYDTHFEKDGSQTLIHDFSQKHNYYFRFEGETHHAGEYQNYIDDFAKCMDLGITPKPDLKEGIHTLSIMEAMQRCLETGTPIRTADVLADYGLEQDWLK